VALPSPRDRDAAREALTTWLSARLGGPDDLVLSELSGPPATGFSNETIVFDATWSASGEERGEGLVVRVRPTSHTVFPSDRFVDQYRVMEALGRHTMVPVPPVRWLEEDPEVLGSPFMVMARVGGEAPPDNPPYTTEGWLVESRPEAQAQLWWDGVEAMAAIHRVDWQELGLDGLEGATTAPGDHAAERLAWWDRYLAWAAAGAPQPVPEAAVAWLRANRPADGADPALCWGDARIGNQLFAGHRVQAVLDWEMVHIGDPQWDLAWFLWMDRHHSEGVGSARLPGFPSAADTVARWEECTGRSAGALGWWEVLAGLGFAAVMVRLSHLLVAFELFPPDSDFAHTNTGVTFLAAELDRIGAR